MSAATRIPRGRQFFANPGPTNIPDSILKAVAHVSVDFNDPAFLKVYDDAVAGVKRILRTQHDVFLYTGSGHAAWEAALVNLFSAGDELLVIETGYFSESWAKMAHDFGLVTRTLAADWRRGADFAALRAMLAADTGHAIKAICAVQNETATGMELPLTEIRAALTATNHPALLLVDTISSLGSMEFRMDDWGVDVAVGGSQKGADAADRHVLHRHLAKGARCTCDIDAAEILPQLDEHADAPAQVLHRDCADLALLWTAGVDPADRGRRARPGLRAACTPR